MEVVVSKGVYDVSMSETYHLPTINSSWSTICISLILANTSYWKLITSYGRVLIPAQPFQVKK